MNEFGVRVIASGKMLKRAVGIGIGGSEDMQNNLLLTEHDIVPEHNAPARWTTQKAAKWWADRWVGECVVVEFVVTELQG